MLQKLFRNKNISKKLKLRLKNTIIDKTCASETSILTQKDIKQINISERKVCRRILGPVYDNAKRKYTYIYDISSLRINDLTLFLLTWRKW
jgi:hypothetical protein